MLGNLKAIDLDEVNQVQGHLGHLPLSNLNVLSDTSNNNNNNILITTIIVIIIIINWKSAFYNIHGVSEWMSECG